MTDKKQVIFDIERCICHVPDACRDCSHYGHGEVIGCMEELLTDALALLKEQKQSIWELQEVNEHLEDKLKKVEQQKFIAHKNGTIEPIPKVVRCKDCKFSEKRKTYHKEDEYKCKLSEYEGCFDYHHENWFCADGERK